MISRMLPEHCQYIDIQNITRTLTSSTLPVHWHPEHYQNIASTLASRSLPVHWHPKHYQYIDIQNVTRTLPLGPTSTSRTLPEHRHPEHCRYMDIQNIASTSTSRTLPVHWQPEHYQYIGIQNTYLELRVIKCLLDCNHLSRLTQSSPIDNAKRSLTNFLEFWVRDLNLFCVHSMAWCCIYGHNFLTDIGCQLQKQATDIDCHMQCSR